MMEDRPMTWNEIAAELTATKAKLAAAEERAEKAEAEWQWNAEMFRDEREAHAATRTERDALQAAVDSAITYFSAVETRIISARSAIRSGQVVDKDAEGTLTRAIGAIERFRENPLAASAAKEQEAMRRVVEAARVFHKFCKTGSLEMDNRTMIALFDALAALDAARQPTDTPDAGEEE